MVNIYFQSTRKENCFKIDHKQYLAFRCNLAVMLLTDLIVDGIDIDWSAHLPHMLHVIFLGKIMSFQKGSKKGGLMGITFFSFAFHQE